MPYWQRSVPIVVLVFLCFAYGRCARAASGSKSRTGATIWTLVLQLPPNRVMRAESGRRVLRGSPESVVGRLRRGPSRFQSLRRMVTGTISIESPRVREITVAGNVLVVSIALPAGRKARVIATNRMPLSEHPGHLTLLNLQLVAEGDMWARSPFAVVDEPGRTAVLFQ